MKRLAVASTPAIVSLMVAAPALAAWTASGAGTGTSRADALQATTAGSAGSATSSSLRLTWSYPATGLQATGWEILRGSTDISTSCAYESGALACVDSGLAASTTYDYSIKAKHGAWRGAATTFTGTTTPPADTTPPTVTSILRAGANPTNAASVSWTVSFSESVTGVDSTDFALAVSGPSNPAISGVTGNGGTWTVTASTGTGSGTLGLNLVDNDSIVDAAGNKLSGTGTGTPGSGGSGNGSTVGEIYTIDKTPPATPTGLTLTTSSDSGSMNNDGVTNVAQATFTGAAEAGTTVRLLNGTTLLGSGLAGAGGTFTIQVANPLVDGSYSITATATDAAGNASASSTAKAVRIDTVAPTAPSISSPTEGQTGVSRRTSFSGSAAETGGIVTVTVRSGTTVVATPTAVPSGNPATWATAELAVNTLADKTQHTATAVHEDVAGNRSTSSAVRTFST